MNNNYACIMGISEHNLSSEPADFWQILFNFDEEKCKEGKREGYIYKYVKQKKSEDDTIKALNKEIKKRNKNWGLMWFQKLPVSYIPAGGYCLVNGDGKIIKQFNKEKMEE
jgi:hypothetical protein